MQDMINLFNCQAMGIVLSCPFVEERDTDFFAYKLPVFMLLVVNTVFLLWIMLVTIFEKIKKKHAEIVSDRCFKTSHLNCHGL